MKRPTAADLIKYISTLNETIKRLEEKLAVEQEESRRWRQSFQPLFDSVQSSNGEIGILEKRDHGGRGHGGVGAAALDPFVGQHVLYDGRSARDVVSARD